MENSSVAKQLGNLVMRTHHHSAARIGHSRALTFERLESRELLAAAIGGSSPVSTTSVQNLLSPAIQATEIAITITNWTRTITFLNQREVMISGTVKAGTSLEIQITDGTKTVVYNATAGTNGRWSVNNIDTVTLSDGTITFTVNPVDPTLIGTATKSATKNITSPVISISNAPAMTNAQNIDYTSVSGLATPGAKILLWAEDKNGVANNPVVGKSGPDGSWSINGNSLTNLSDGTITYHAIAIVESNTSRVANFVAKKDTVPPRLTIDALDSIGHHNFRNYTISGKSEPLAAIQIAIYAFYDSIGLDQPPLITTAMLGVDASTSTWTINGLDLLHGRGYDRARVEVVATDAAGNSSQAWASTGIYLSPYRAELKAGVLYIYGTRDDDNLQVERTNNRVQVRQTLISDISNQQPLQAVPASRVTRVIVYGYAGNDSIYLQSLNPSGNRIIPTEVYGGLGNDRIYGSDGPDELHGEAGHDIIFGNGGHDRIFGEAGNDVLYGGDGNDYVHGGGGEDLLYGGRGNDELYGDRGNDWLFGEDGDDIIWGRTGEDYVNGGGQSGDQYLDISTANRSYRSHAYARKLPPAINIYSPSNTKLLGYSSVWISARNMSFSFSVSKVARNLLYSLPLPKTLSSSSNLEGEMRLYYVESGDIIDGLLANNNLKLIEGPRQLSLLTRRELKDYLDNASLDNLIKSLMRTDLDTLRVGLEVVHRNTLKIVLERLPPPWVSSALSVVNNDVLRLGLMSIDRDWSLRVVTRALSDTVYSKAVRLVDRATRDLMIGFRTE